MPGSIWVTRTGWPRSSRRSVSVTATRACLAAVYPAPPSYASSAAMEPMLTMTPSPPAMSLGRNARVTRMTPSTLASYIHRHFSSSASASGSSPRAPPALFTSTSQASTSAANASTDAVSVTSNASGRAPRGPATSRNLSMRRAPTTTSKPSFARRAAVAAPMPLLAPVTTAVRVTGPVLLLSRLLDALGGLLLLLEQLCLGLLGLGLQLLAQGLELLAALGLLGLALLLEALVTHDFAEDLLGQAENLVDEP